MSTLRTNTAANRLAKLIRLKSPLFHINDLANIWQIHDKNTLHTTLKRYTQKKLLYRIHKGFYSIVPISEIDPYLLGVSALKDFAYIGGETILFEHGIIFQKQNSINIISSISLHFSIGNYSYRVRQLSDQYLFNSIGIEEKNGVNYAGLERSIADILYFNPNYYFDADPLINWSEVKKIQKIIGYIK